MVCIYDYHMHVLLKLLTTIIIKNILKTSFIYQNIGFFTIIKISKIEFIILMVRLEGKIVKPKKCNKVKNYVSPVMVS